jgi:3-oxoacyl-[acyl-carrier protein] reductase
MNEITSNPTPGKTLTGKTALITGASRGIGRAIAARLAQDGASVVVNYHSNLAAAESLVASITSTGGKAIAVQADASKLEDLKRLFDTAQSEYGSLEIVVLNPGNFLMKPLAEVTEEEFDKVFALNTRGVFFGMQEAAKRISDGGSSISLSSGVTAVSSEGSSVYAGSKAAAEKFTVALAKELGSRGVTVNTVSPSITNTDGLVVPQAMIDRMKSMIPLGRIGEPEDIANVVAFLVGPQGHWINAQNIRANGGMV